MTIDTAVDTTIDAAAEVAADSDFYATFATAVDLARRRLSLDDVAGAHNLLAPWHATAPAAGDSDQPIAMFAAALYATILDRLGDYSAAMTWATHAYLAYERMYGADDPRTLRVAASAAYQMTRAGRLDDAVALYDIVYQTREDQCGATAPITLCTAADLAGAMHSAGDCEAAHALMEDTILAASSTFGKDHRTTVRMIIRHAVRLRDCGHRDAARDWFEDARTRTRRDDRNLIVAVARIAQLPARSDHTCWPAD